MLCVDEFKKPFQIDLSTNDKRSSVCVLTWAQCKRGNGLHQKCPNFFRLMNSLYFYEFVSLFVVCRVYFIYYDLPMISHGVRFCHATLLSAVAVKMWMSIVYAIFVFIALSVPIENVELNAMCVCVYWSSLFRRNVRCSCVSKVVPHFRWWFLLLLLPLEFV